MIDVLVVFCPQQSAEMDDVKSLLATLGEVQFHCALDGAEALKRLRRQASIHLIVVGTHLAADTSTPVDDHGWIAFCDAARTTARAPIVLMAPRLTGALLKECDRFSKLRPLDDRSELLATAQEFLRATASPVVHLDIRVTASDSGWSYTMQGMDDFEFRAADRLTVHRSAWMLWTGLHHTDEYWYLDFKRIGDSIRTCLCDENPRFKLDLDMASTRAVIRAANLGFLPSQAIVESQVTFLVSKTYYPLVLEAIFHPNRAEEPWLAYTRLGRRLLGSRSERGDLFHTGSGPLRALIVCADTHGFCDDPAVSGRTLKLKALTKIQDECKRIAARLSRIDPNTGRPWFSDANIRQLGKGGEPVSERALMEAMREGPWDLVHFAGHSYFRAPDREGDVGSGYLFVGKPGKPEAVKFSYVASFLRAARFVYLSSCESGSSSFAVEATANGIHSAIGYRWSVNDGTADLQARLFYRDLLRYRSVDMAFWNARRCMYRRYTHKQNIWASAMLVSPES